MGNQGFHGEARAPANKPSIVQERNKAAISYVNASTQVSDIESVYHSNLQRDTGVTPSVTLHCSDDIIHAVSSFQKLSSSDRRKSVRHQRLIAAVV